MSVSQDEMARLEAERLRVEEFDRKLERIRLRIGDALTVARNKLAAMAVQR